MANDLLITHIAGIEFKEGRDFWGLSHPQLRKDGGPWADDIGLYILSNPEMLAQRVVKLGITRAGFRNRFLGFQRC